MNRRRWVQVGAAIGVPAVAASLWFAWLPGKIAREAEERGRARGWDVEVGDVWPGLMSVELEEVNARTEGLEAELDSIELDAGPFGLAFGGTDAVEAIAVRGGSVEIRSALFEGRGEAASSAGGAGRALALEDVRLSVVDDHGALGEAVLSGSFGGDVLSLTAEEARLGEAPSHQLLASRVELEATRGEGGWQVADLQAEGAELRIGRGPPGTGEDAADAEPAATEPTDPTEPSEASEAAEGDDAVEIESEDDASESGEATEPAGAPPATRVRVRRFIAGVTGARAAPAGAPEEPGDSEGEADDGVADAESGPVPAVGPTGLERIAEGAELRVVGMSVTRTGAEGEPERVLSDLVAEVTRTEDRFHVKANAEGSGGSLHCDLRVGWDPPSLEGSFGAQRLPFDVLVPFLPDLPWHRPEEARISLDVRLDAPSPEQVDVAGSLTLTGLSFEHSRLSRVPIRGVAFSADGEATLRPLEGRLVLEDVTITAGDASAQLAGVVVADDGIQEVELHAELPSTPCNDAVAAIPRDLLDEASGFSWQGSLAGRLDLELAMSALDEASLDIDVSDGCQFETVPALADLRRVRTTFIHRVREPDGSVFEMATGPGTANWTPLVATSPYLVHAVVGHEDAGFFGHDGFAVYAIRDALKRNLREGRYVVGASTITMQLAKNLFLHREKTLARKVQEVLLTWWLETALTKAEILELYLNVIEYGPGVYGITRAAEHYFGRPPAELSPAESAYLAAILPNPKGLQASYERGSLTSAMRNRMTRFLTHLRDKGRITGEALTYALEELDTFTFHQEGQPAAERILPDGAGPLPVATATTARAADPEDWDYGGEDDWVDEWQVPADGPADGEGGG